MAACFVCVSVSQCVRVSNLFSIHFLCCSYLFNAKTDQARMWYDYALKCGEHNAGGFTRVIKVVQYIEIG